MAARKKMVHKMTMPGQKPMPPMKAAMPAPMPKPAMPMPKKPMRSKKK